MPPPNVRANSPDSSRATVAIADLDLLVTPTDRPIVEAHLSLVLNAPGPALLVWGPEAMCLAYNRHYRALSGLRASALGKPLMRVQPELERPWRTKLDLAFAGTAGVIDGTGFTGGGDGAPADQIVGWFVPVPGAEPKSRGVLALLIDASATLDPMRRLLGAVVHDFREPLVGIQVVSERLSRLPKPTRERCVEDMDRILELTHRIDRLIEDLSAYLRRSAGGSGARLSLRPGDRGALVKVACERLPPGAGRVTVKALDVQGLWDEEAVQRIVTALVLSARQNEGGNVFVEVTSSREGAVITIRDDGAAPRVEEVDQLFEPWRRGGAPSAERRRRGVGVALYLARELVFAHGGKITSERPNQGGFIMRVLLPVVGSGTPSSAGRRS
jgi:signal transduction histidine kinase